MKFLIPALAVIALAFTSAAQAFECGQGPVLSTTKADGTKIGLFISEDQIMASPKWSPENGEPPLPLSRAATITKQWAKAEYKRFDGVNIQTINLNPYGCWKHRDHWYYVFHFSPVIDGNALYGSA